MYNTLFKIIILSLLTVSIVNAELLEIKVNKIHGLLLFNESIAGLKNRAPSHKKIYDKQYADNKELLAHLKKLKTIYKKLRGSKIYGYPRIKGLMSAIRTESSFVKDIADLKYRIMTTYQFSVSSKLLDDYFKMLDIYLPVYESLIWDKSYAEMLEIKTRIENIIEAKNINEMIKTTAIFYQRNPKKLKIFYLNLHPVPKGKSVKAFRIANTASVGVVLGGKRKTRMNLIWLLSATIFHEICHDLYGPNKQKIKKMFEKYSSRAAKRVSKIINETLATAIGAGWAFNKLTGANARNSWYNNKEYDRFAKALYKDVSSYLEQGKSLDDNFIQISIRKYKISAKK